jgi:hypothetical protein
MAHNDGTEIRAQQMGKLGVAAVHVLLRGLVYAPGHGPAGRIDALGGYLVHDAIGRVRAASLHQGSQMGRSIKLVALCNEGGSGGLHHLAQAGCLIF